MWKMMNTYGSECSFVILREDKRSLTIKCMIKRTILNANIYVNIFHTAHYDTSSAIGFQSMSLYREWFVGWAGTSLQFSTG